MYDVIMIYTTSTTQDESNFQREPWRVSKTIINECHNAYHYSVTYTTLSTTIYNSWI